MRKDKHKAFTLIEIIISIAVLSVVSVIFLELFVKSDFIQKQGRITDDKTFLISNLLEILAGQQDLNGFRQASLPADERTEGKKRYFDFYFDDQLQKVAQENQTYYLRLIVEESQLLQRGRIYLVRAQAFFEEEERPLEITTYFYEQGGD